MWNNNKKQCKHLNHEYMYHLLIIILANSSKFMQVSASMSASLMISFNSYSVSFSPIFSVTAFRSATEMSPFPFLSKTLNASWSSFSVLISCIFLNSKIGTCSWETWIQGSRWIHFHRHRRRLSNLGFMLLINSTLMIWKLSPIPKIKVITE